MGVPMMDQHHHRGGRHGLHSGRKLSSSDLQLVLLALLEKNAGHGYELMKSLEELSNGFYVPSPGMIYPSLTYLVEAEHVDVESEGNKKRYTLNALGKQFLDDNRRYAEQILDELAQIGSRMDDARRVLAGEANTEEEIGWQSEELREIRGQLKTFLRGYEPPSRQEDSRICRALRSALSEIHRTPGDNARTVLDPGVFLRVIAERRSMGLSRLKPDAVDRELIERMLEAANWAPSHEETEPWRFTVFTGEGREKLAELFALAQRPTEHDHDGARKRAFAAPVWISIGMSPRLDEAGALVMSEDEELMAVACAVQNLHLMASVCGLAGMWHSKGPSVHPEVARGLGLEAPSRLLGFFMCGWPATDWLTCARGPVSEKVTWVEAT